MVIKSISPGYDCFYSHLVRLFVCYLSVVNVEQHVIKWPVLFQGCDGIELLDLLFDQNNGILRHEEMGHHGNHAWPIHKPNVSGVKAFTL